MAKDILMPQMGYDMTQGTIVRWLKKVGDKVHKGDVVAEIETDKATVEIEAFADGQMLRIVAQPGETVPVGRPIAMLGEPGEALPEPEQEQEQEPAPKPASEKPAANKPLAAAPKPAAPQPPAARPAPARAASPALAPTESHASPLARRLAAELGVDLTTVAGTGPGGRIVRADVEAAAGGEDEPPAETALVAEPAAAQPLPEGAEDIELSKLRQTIARRMQQSKQTAPHFYVSVDIVADAMLALRGKLEGKKTKVSVNDFLVKALALAALEHPQVNAAYIDGRVRRFKRVDVGIAVATDNGLLSPALMDCGAKSLGDIAREAKDLSQRARTGHLRPEEYGGGTITLSNLGMFGVDAFMAILNPPQAVIVSVGAAAERVVAKGGKPAVARVMTAWAAADHRVLDGADVARFLATFKELVEAPDKLAK